MSDRDGAELHDLGFVHGSQHPGYRRSAPFKLLYREISTMFDSTVLVFCGSLTGSWFINSAFVDEVCPVIVMA